jgi:hypothetical protein
MNHSIMKCARRQLQWQCRLICVSAAMSFFILSAHAQTAILPPIGGTGGGQFIARCAGNELLNGFELRAGDDVDAIRPLCITAYGLRETTAAPLTRGSGLVTLIKSPLGQQFDKVKLESGWYGGTGGGLRNVICPEDTPIVTGMYVRWEGLQTFTVNNIHLFCGVAAATQQPSDFPSAVFDAPPAKDKHGLFADEPVNDGDGTQRCPDGLVGVGINGRSGLWLDAVGLICGEPKLTPKPPGPVALGRVQGTTPKGPPMSICDRARDARARNSPAAPSLEAQCLAAGDKLPRVALGGAQELTQKKKQDQIVISDPGKQRASNVRDRIRAEDTVPANAIRVTVRYRKEYGYKGDTNAFGDVAPTSCDAFSVNVAVGDSAVRPGNPIPISSDFKMEEVSGEYVCSYLVSELPLNETIRVGVSLSRSLVAGQWKGGSESQPPPGQQRTILDATRTLTLTVSNPRAALSFEMVYAPLPLKPPNQPVPQRRKIPMSLPSGAATPQVRRLDD